MLGQVQNAASDAVDHTILASAAPDRYVDRMEEPNHRPLQTPLFTNQQPAALQNPGAFDTGGNMTPPSFRGNGDNGWAGFSSQESFQRMGYHFLQVLSELMSSRQSTCSNTFYTSTKTFHGKSTYVATSAFQYAIQWFDYHTDASEATISSAAFGKPRYQWRWSFWTCGLWNECRYESQQLGDQFCRWCKACCPI